MEIKNYLDGKIIILSKAFDTRGKVLYMFYFISYTGLALYFMRSFATMSDSTITLIIIVLAVISAYIFAGFRFINKALQTEKLIIAPNSLIITRKGFLSKETLAYDISFVTNLRHLTKEDITKHPLAGQTFDYLGFQTQQQVINEMHGDNRIAFDYGGATVQFGENMYSWDFEQIGGLIFEITGKDVRYKGMKKRNLIEEA